MARMLRDCTDSDKVNLLKAHAEVLFYRLMMKADDYGSFYANVKLIKSSCYPLRTDAVRDADITRWMDELLKAGLIVVYMNAGKSYLRILNFGQRLRNKKRKFPPDPSDDGSTVLHPEGYVYIIGDFKTLVKIGFSLNPWARVKEVSAKEKRPLSLLMIFKGSMDKEKAIHSLLKNLHVGREWFKLSRPIIDLFKDSYDNEGDADELIVALRSVVVDSRSPELELEVEVELEVEEEEEKADAHPPELVDDFEKFKVWIADNAPRVAKMKEPFAIDQFSKIKTQFTVAKISDILMAMHNWEPLIKKNRSAYLTANKWLQKEKDGTNQKPFAGGITGQLGTSGAQSQAARDY